MAGTRTSPATRLASPPRSSARPGSRMFALISASMRRTAAPVCAHEARAAASSRASSGVGISFTTTCPPSAEHANTAQRNAPPSGYRPLGPSGACRPRTSMQCLPRHRPTHIQPASGSICRSVGTTGLRTAAVIVVSTCPAGAEKVRVTADGGEVARIVRGWVPAEVALAERRRPFVASQLPPRSPLGSPG